MQGEKSSKIRIFVGYYKPNFVFESKVFQPLLTSAIDWEEQPDILRDNTGINIAEGNKYYGELSGHYWVWKNFLPTTNVEYIGFCHYRRFLDFNLTKMPDVPFKPMFLGKFKGIFKKYAEEKILKCIKDYDIILPHKLYFEDPIYDQYIKYHPKIELDLALEILYELYPEYKNAAQKVMESERIYLCLNFIMKKELLNEYMEWMFNILTTLEKRSDWTKYVSYMDVRVPAFIAERFFNIWIEHNIEKRDLKLITTSSIYLMGEGYSESDPNKYLRLYDAFVYLLDENNLAAYKKLKQK